MEGNIAFFSSLEVCTVLPDTMESGPQEEGFLVIPSSTNMDPVSYVSVVFSNRDIASCSERKPRRTVVLF